MANPQIKVTGLKELRATLKAMSEDTEWRGELKTINRAAAGVAVDEAQSLAGRGATIHSGKHATMGHVARATIRALGGANSAVLAGGSAAVPWFPPWNFGGRANQFPSPGSPDNYLFRSIENKRNEIENVYLAGMDRFTAAKFR